MNLGGPVHVLATDTASSQPWWLVVAGILGTILVAFLTARGPVWLEKVKERRNAPNPAAAAAEKVATGEEVLREWLEATRRDLKSALRENERLEQRISELERELIRARMGQP